ncbi:MAG: ABC transporter [Rhodovulum sulfidophilum]|uniref:ABC transporter n=1 Tax=Rhodovulum sulfidophilum TaxID=35806 RepID=A0A2W5NDK7_RHOSU|nr:MAG: ABC transporter [Rhodovulum sulfidophilum]
MSARSLARATLALVLPVVLLGGCGAVASLNTASQPLPTFDLGVAAGTPARAAPTSRRVLLVAAPSALGAFDSDRMVIKPNALQVAYLPDSRWVDSAPRQIQTLLIRAIANSGAVGYVGGDAAGPLPDYVLLTDIQAFQAELTPAGQPDQVTVRLTLTMVRDADRRLVGSRIIERHAPLAGTDPLTVANAFNAAMTSLLDEATRWTISSMGGRVG